MKTNPKISVIMPVYNGEKYLSEAIESILNQTYRDLEFIIINDASTDSSPEIAESYAHRDARIRIIQNDKNLGISGATNRGIEEAQGEYIALMDQDDISLPERFEKEANFLEEHEQIAAISSNSLTLKENGEICERQAVFETPGLIRWGLLFKNQIQNSAAMMRKAILFQNNLRYEEFSPAQDYRFWSRLCLIADIANLQEPLIYHRLHENNASKLMLELQNTRTYAIRKDLIKRSLDYLVSDRTISILLHQGKPLSSREAEKTLILLIDWYRMNKRHGLEKTEIKYIRKKTSRVIREIWNKNNKTFRLLHYVVYSIFLKVWF